MLINLNKFNILNNNFTIKIEKFCLICFNYKKLYCFNCFIKNKKKFNFVFCNKCFIRNNIICNKKKVFFIFVILKKKINNNDEFFLKFKDINSEIFKIFLIKKNG